MKKIISILCLITVFASNVFVTEAKAFEASTEQIQTVCQLGIMNENEDGEYDLTGFVTRAEFAEMVYRIVYGTKDAPGATKSYYNDVNIYHYAAPYIQALSEQGIIFGYEDGNFYPGNNITAGQAVTIILRAIGYNVRLNSGDSINAVASEAKIGKGLDFSSELTKEACAKVIYDALYADTLKMSYDGKGISRADTVMYEFLGLKYKDGVVDGINGRSLYDKTIRDGTVSIDETQYDIACKVDDDLLGKNVRFYYNEKDEEVRAIVPRNNLVLVIDADSISTGTNKEIVYYTQNDKRRTARIDVKADILYNGYVVNSISDYLPKNGEITLIDRKEDGIYDAVFITEYTSYLVSRVNERDETIASYNSAASINLKNYDKVEIVDKNNEQSELKSINANTVISVYEFGTKYIKIVKSDETVTGTIKAISTSDSGKTVIEFGDEQFKLYDDCYLSGITLSVGANITIYLDVYGLGAAVKTETKDDWEFGYIIDVREDRRTLMEESVRLKVLTVDNNQELLYLVDKVKVDGNKLRISEVMSYLNNVFNNFDDEIAGGAAYKKELVTTRLIRFKRSDNIIYQLDTPTRYGLYETTGKPQMAQNDRLLLRVKGDLYRPESQRGFKAVYSDRIDLPGEVVYTRNTPIFIVPTEENTDADEEDYSVVSGDDFVSSVGEFIYMASYYTDINSLTPDAIVVRKDAFENSDTRLLVVEKTLSVWDEKEGEVSTQIKGYINGNLTAMSIDEKNSTIPVNSIKKGDVIAYNMFNERLRLSQLVYRKGGGGALDSSYYWPSNPEGPLFNMQFRSILGKAGHIDGNYMHLKFDNGSKVDELVTLPGRVVYYSSSESKDSVYMSDPIGIMENDIVIVSSRKGVQQDVIVIK